MRPVRKVTASEENFRLEDHAGSEGAFAVIRRDGIKPEPEGTIVLMAFRVEGYDADCDGSLMARLTNIDRAGRPTGWEPKGLGLYPDCGLVVSDEELAALGQGKVSQDMDKKGTMEITRAVADSDVEDLWALATSGILSDSRLKDMKVVLDKMDSEEEVMSRDKFKRILGLLCAVFLYEQDTRSSLGG